MTNTLRPELVRTLARQMLPAEAEGLFALLGSKLDRDGFAALTACLSYAHQFGIQCGIDTVRRLAKQARA